MSHTGGTAPRGPGAPSTQRLRRANIRLTFTDPGPERTVDLTFDAEEIVAAFARAGAGGRPVDLVISAPRVRAPGDPEYEVRVRGAADETALRKVKIEVFGPA